MGLVFVSHLKALHGFVGKSQTDVFPQHLPFLQKHFLIKLLQYDSLSSFYLLTLCSLIRFPSITDSSVFTTKYLESHK